MFQNQANGSHENNGMGEIGGKDGFGIESGGARETGKGLRLGSTRESQFNCLVSKRLTSTLYNNFADTLLEDLYSVLNDAWQHTPLAL